MPKPVVTMSASQSNIFNMTDLAVDALKDAGKTEEAIELQMKLMQDPLSRLDQIRIILEYVDFG